MTGSALACSVLWEPPFSGPGLQTHRGNTSCDAPSFSYPLTLAISPPGVGKEHNSEKEYGETKGGHYKSRKKRADAYTAPAFSRKGRLNFIVRHSSNPPLHMGARNRGIESLPGCCYLRCHRLPTRRSPGVVGP